MIQIERKANQPSRKEALTLAHLRAWADPCACTHTYIENLLFLAIEKKNTSITFLGIFFIIKIWLVFVLIKLCLHKHTLIH